MSKHFHAEKNIIGILYNNCIKVQLRTEKPKYTSETGNKLRKATQNLNVCKKM